MDEFGGKTPFVTARAETNKTSVFVISTLPTRNDIVSDTHKIQFSHAAIINRSSTCISEQTKWHLHPISDSISMQNTHLFPPCYSWDYRQNTTCRRAAGTSTPCCRIASAHSYVYSPRDSIYRTPTRSIASRPRCCACTRSNNVDLEIEMKIQIGYRCKFILNPNSLCKLVALSPSITELHQTN